MTTWTANSDTSFQDMIGDLRELYQRHHFLRVIGKSGKARSLDQNAIGHAWYQQLARELREYDAAAWKRFCKLHFGVPILRAEDEEFKRHYDFVFKALTYEQKIEAMEHLPVTSLMTIPQESRYLEAMQEHFADRVRLEFPSDARAAA